MNLQSGALIAVSLLLSSTLSSTGWAAPPAQVPLERTRNIQAVYQISGDGLRSGVSEGLFYLQKLLETYDRLGVAPGERKLVAVVHGDAGKWLLGSEAYARHTGGKGSKPAANPNTALVAGLIERGVSVELCAQTMARHGWQPADLLPGVKIVPAAYARVIDLQLGGYAHLLFD